MDQRADNLPAPAFLGVENSLLGQRWIGPSIEDDRAAEALVQAANLPRPVAHVLAQRGVSAAEVPSYLEPALRDLLPDPRRLKDMDQAARRLIAAVQEKERIAIFADYDVDGGSSAALLVSWLRHFQMRPTLYVPDRIDEGYGPNEPAMADLAARHDLIICVDCGTLSHAPVAAAKSADVLILDHHLGSETLPDALAVVNPNRQDEDGSLGHLCAAAVVFLCLVEAGRQLREASQQSPDLLALLDLVALATVADVAPLTGVNRAFVRQGLKVMAHRARPGLVALGDLAGLDAKPAPYHLGFVLGPRINAGGRVGQADLGARLLSTSEPHEAQALAQRLEALNADRRDIEAAVRAAAFAQAESRGLEGPLVWAAGDAWHPGVVGIVASRLKDAAKCPAIVIGIADGIGKGSGRSVSGVDLGSAIQRLASEGLLIKGGGHKMAAGLTVEEHLIPAAMQRLSELLERQGTAPLGGHALRIDGLLKTRAVTVDMLEMLEDAGPYGAGSPAPRFVFTNLRISSARRIGENHLKVVIEDNSHARLDAIAFGAFDSALGPALLSHGGARYSIVGRLELNDWRGRRTPQLRIEDAVQQ